MSGPGPGPGPAPPAAPAVRGAPDADEFRRVMGRYPTGAVVVATMLAGRPYGMAVNSFTSVSLDPMLVLFCVHRSSRTWGALQASGRFAVSVLAADQAPVCRVFATPGADRFASLPWATNDSGQPVLGGAVAWLDCVITAVVDGGDHEVVFGAVRSAHDRPDGGPLVCHRGEFTGLP